MRAWIVTVDHIDQYDPKTGEYTPVQVNVSGPRGVKMSEEDIKAQGTPFKMYDDDKNLYYEGFAMDSETEDGFAPLEDYGTPNAGCTYIEYLRGDKWEML